MKKYAVALLLVLTGLFTARAEHYIGVTAGFQSPFLLDRLAETSPRIGYGGLAGVEWFWQWKLLTVEAGLQVAYTVANTALPDESLRFNMHDTQGKPFVYQGEITDRRESFPSLDLQIPLLVGLEYKRFYLSAGPIIVYTATGRMRQSAYLTTTGDYDRYYELLEDMPNHGFSDLQPVNSQTRLSSGLDVRVHAETGGVWHTGSAKWRAGLFCDYGLLNLLAAPGIYRRGASVQPVYEVDTERYMSVTLHPVYASEMTEETPLNNLSAGIRITVLFPLSSLSSSSSSSSRSRPPRKRTSGSCHCVQ